jgi:hypothetical protein
MIHIFAPMMKNTVKYTLTIIMAALVFYGGAGINIISYCCNQCRSAGIEALLEDKCCEIHHHDHTHAADKHESPAGASSPAQDGRTEDRHHGGTHHTASCHYCTDHASGNCCNMERIHFDWNTQNTAKTNIDLSPVVFDLLPSGILAVSAVNLLTCEAGTTMPDRPPLVRPRDYLTLLTLLLI